MKMVATSTLILWVTLSACGEATPPPPAPVAAKRLSKTKGRVAFVAPAPHWKLVDPADDPAHGLPPGAVLGVREASSCQGWVRVSEATRDRAQHATERLDAQALDDERLVMDEDVLYQGETWRRWELWGNDETGVRVGQRATFRVEKGSLYEIRAVARDSHFSKMRRCLDTVTAAFEFL